VQETSSAVSFQSIAPQFVVPDVVKAAEYYRDSLGFEILGYFLDPPVYAIVKRQGVEIHFGKSSAPPRSSTSIRPEGMDAYIFVDDVDRLAKEFAERSTNIVEGPVDRIYGRREITVVDCFGYKIVFGS
jgi:uncharacterized glyoxalase superfamily protein PhnB